MCDCSYCQGNKPWSDEPYDWPHTPPLHVFLTKRGENPNLWWYMPDGHRQNIADDAIDMCEELINENKLIKHDLTSILTDLIAELRSPFFSMDPELDPVLDRAEARLREVQGE